MKKKVITPPNTPSYFAEWGFSPAVEYGGLIFASGCTGTGGDGPIPEGIAAQTEQAFQDIKRVLDAANIGFENIIEMTTYHVNLSAHLDAFKRVKETYIFAPYPAWTAIGITELAVPGALIEIRVIAHRSS